MKPLGRTKIAGEGCFRQAAQPFQSERIDFYYVGGRDLNSFKKRGGPLKSNWQERGRGRRTLESKSLSESCEGHENCISRHDSR